MSQNEEQLAKEAVLNFLGTTYGELKKLDGNVIGPSSTLGHRSDEVKNELERFIEQNKSQPVNTHVQEPTYPENNLPDVQQPQVQQNQPVLPLQPIQQQIVVDDPRQGEFNFDVNEKEELFNLVEKILTRLDKLHKKVDEISLVHQDFVKTYQEAKEVLAKKKSSTRKKVVSKEEK